MTDSQQKVKPPKKKSTWKEVEKLIKTENYMLPASPPTSPRPPTCQCNPFPNVHCSCQLCELLAKPPETEQPSLSVRLFLLSEECEGAYRNWIRKPGNSCECKKRNGTEKYNLRPRK